MFDLNFLNFRSYVSALARGEELWCIWPAANRHWACAPMDHSENVFIRIKDMTLLFPVLINTFAYDGAIRVPIVVP